MKFEHVEAVLLFNETVLLSRLGCLIAAGTRKGRLCDRTYRSSGALLACRCILGIEHLPVISLQTGIGTLIPLMRHDCFVSNQVRSEYPVQ